uniref:RAB11 family interacting protein 1 (class I) b n=1 Tax=Hucho hucho TaxID=62062 RepID=A0A4W5KP03_9TELE
MALADQSQQWYPTSVQVTVIQARNLRIKGKNGTNDAYAIMQVAKDKFSTSVAEKCVAPVWKEEATFDLPLFHHGNAERCTLYIIVMHRALVGLDKLLGQAVINLLDLHDNSARKKTEPHPVKPMSSIESQAPISTPVVGEMLTYDCTLGKMKAPGMVESGPYTQLTQEELITLVVKQQMELSKKDSKIVELEEYIDNLLVRVIEEKPSILLGLNSVKQAL